MRSNEDEEQKEFKQSEIQKNDSDDNYIIHLKKKQKKSSKQQQVIESTTISVVINGALAFFFFKFSTEEYHYGGKECSNLRIWAYYYAFYCMLVVIVRLFVFLPVYFMMVKGKGKQVKGCFHCLIVYQTLEVCMSFIFFIGITISYFEDEPCKNLRLLTKIYLLLVFVLLATICCCAIAVAGVIGGIKIGGNDDEEIQNE